MSAERVALWRQISLVTRGYKPLPPPIASTPLQAIFSPVCLTHPLPPLLFLPPTLDRFDEVGPGARILRVPDKHQQLLLLRACLGFITVPFTYKVNNSVCMFPSEKHAL